MRRSMPASDRLKRAAALLALWAGVLLGAQAAQAGPRDFRVKIDRVDTSDAPTARLFVTVLDDRDMPVNPKLIDLFQVRVNGQKVDDGDVEMGIWRDEEAGTDLVVVLPATAGLSESSIGAISESLKVLEKALKEKDRVALVTYSRAVTVPAPLAVDKTKPKQEFDKAERKGVRPFMFSALDKAIELLETSPEGRKRAILYLGDGTDAGTTGVIEINAKLEETVARARRAKIQIWTLGFDPAGMSETSRRTLSLMSRKTGATWRVANTKRGLGESIDATFGEIVGQLVITIEYDFNAFETYEFQVKLQSESSEETESLPFKAPVEKVRFDWIFWGIVCGLSCITLAVLTLVTLITTVTLRRRQARKEAEELLKELLEDRPPTCEVCSRAQKPEWEACPFCAEGMAPLPPSTKEPLFVYDDEDRKICNKCGRVCAPEWTACAFDAQGMEPLDEWVKLKREEAMLTGNIDPEKMAEEARQAAAAAAAASVAERQAQLASGGRECPKCRRIMDAKWPECLFCASGLPPLK